MPYKIAEGHGVALVSLTDIDPQPRSAGVKHTRTTYAASGVVYREAAYLELQWSVVGSATDYQALLAQFGLDALISANVTVYARDDQFVWTRWNGRAVRPMPGDGVDWDVFPKGIKIVVRDLVAL